MENIILSDKTLLTQTIEDPVNKDIDVFIPNLLLHPLNLFQRWNLENPDKKYEQCSSKIKDADYEPINYVNGSVHSFNWNEQRTTFCKYFSKKKM